jgi:uncharacterized membrane protein
MRGQQQQGALGALGAVAGVVVLLVGCETAPAPPPADGAAAGPPPEGAPAGAHPVELVVGYGCQDDLAFSAEFGGDGVTLLLPDQRARLEQSVEGGGTVYTDERLTLRLDGDEVWLESVDGWFLSCHMIEGPEPWAAARRRGAAFRAIGQEPGWTVELWPGEEMILALAYGEDTLRVATGEGERGREAGSVVYRGESAGRHATVTLQERVCHDTMSGVPAPVSVLAQVDGRRYSGCGRWLH